MSIKTNPLIYLTSKMWHYSKGNRPRVVLYVVLVVLANSVYLSEPLVVAKILNVVQQEGVTQDNLAKILLLLSLFVLLTLLFWLLHGPARVLEMKNAFNVRAKYKKFLLDGVMSLPAAWHTDHHSGNTIDKIEKGTKSLYDYSAESFDLIQNVVRLVFGYCALVYFNVHASYLVAFAVIGTIYLILQFDKVLEKQYTRLNRMENKISAKVYDSISNITTVIILRIEKLVSTSIYKKIMTPWKLFKYNVKLNEVKWFIVNMCGTVMTFMVMGSYIAFNAWAGEVVLFGTVYLLYSYTEKIQWMFFMFAYLYGTKMRQKMDVLNAEELTKDFPKNLAQEKAELPSNWQQFKITGLNFSYSGKDGDLNLRNIKFKAKHGEKVAFIGESGSGKTTMMKLIRGLYQAQSLDLTVDSKELTDFNSISADISLIPQDPEIFNSTIKDNLTFGIPYTEKEIKKFTDLAEFTETIKRLPKGLDSSIVERGVNLSGGEKQRLALARGLMASQDKEIILLDEPTSSVDSKNELKIYQNIFQAFPEKTIISSIHRLHLLEHFDFIYFFKNGRIIAHGPLESLLLTSSEFKNLWNKYHKSIK